MPRGEPKYGHRQVLKPRRKPSPLAPTMRPVTEIQKAPITISTSNILRRKPMKEVYGKKHSRRRECRHELFLEYQDRIEDSRTELRHTSHAALAQTHADFTASLATLETQDSDFYDKTTEQRQILLVPIAEERVETNFTRNGKSVKEVIQIGQRVDAFKAMLSGKKADLALLWAEWEKVQARIVRLGVQVLGAEALGGGEGVIGSGSAAVAGDGEGEGEGDGLEESGYARKMRALEVEHEEWLEEMRDEIRIIGEETVRMMEATEKELAATAKREKVNFIKRLIEDVE